MKQITNVHRHYKSASVATTLRRNLLAELVQVVPEVPSKLCLGVSYRPSVSNVSYRIMF